MRISLPRLLPLTLIAAVAIASAPATARSVEPTWQRTTALGNAGDVDVAARPPPKKRPPPRKKAPRPPPDTRRPAGKRVNPAAVGGAAAGGAAVGALVGATSVAVSTLVLFGTFGAPTLPVVITFAVLGIGLGVATPFLAAIGGGSMVLAMNPRTKPDEWSQLLQCAASGYCLGLNVIGGTLLGSVCPVGNACGDFVRPPRGDEIIPGPDRAAEWTAGAAIAGLVGGSVMGGLVGWSVSPVPEEPLIPITIGALGGAVLGSGVSAGVAAAVATAINTPRGGRDPRDR